MSSSHNADTLEFRAVDGDRADPSDEQRRHIRLRVRQGLQFMDLGFFLLYALILMQIALEALGAHDWAGFKKFLDAATGPFLGPFKNLFADPQMHNHQIMLSYIAALIVYLLLQSGIKRLVELVLRTALTPTR